MNLFGAEAKFTISNFYHFVNKVVYGEKKSLDYRKGNNLRKFSEIKIFVYFSFKILTSI